MIDRNWWDHLAPRAIKPHRGLVERMIQSQAARVVGAEWVSIAKRPGGVFRLKIGQRIPVFHVVVLGSERSFIKPPPAREPEHRTVGHERTFASSLPLKDDEIAIPPEICVEVVTDPVFIEAARNGLTEIDESLVRQPSQIFSCPAHLLLRPQGYPKKSFVLYQHIFGRGASYPDQGWFYVGITTRSWQKRWSEHRRAIEHGSPLLFHRKFREEHAAGAVTYVNHKIMGITSDLEALYGAEEFLVEGHWDDARRLNMVPGGKSALRYMRENGMISPGVIPLPDDRDEIIRTWLADHPRKGLPAPWVSEKWRDDAWAIAQICGREGRLSVEQVRAIRSLARDFSPEQIAERIGARNVAQVERVLDGKTYSRVQ